jgi:hypothetical protein
MALTANALPTVVPDFSVPIDANLQFASGQTLTATGYVNNDNQQLDVGPGRLVGILALDITALDVSSSNETYSLALLGSNDVNWGNGNVELLLLRDFAAASSGRVVPTICGASPTVPPTGLAGSYVYLPFTTVSQRIIYRYLRLYAVLGGTTPSITLSAWVSPIRTSFGG